MKYRRTFEALEPSRINHFKIDRVFLGEVPIEVLNSEEVAILEQRLHSTQVGSAASPLVADATNASTPLTGLVGVLIVGGIVALAASSFIGGLQKSRATTPQFEVHSKTEYISQTKFGKTIRLTVGRRDSARSRSVEQLHFALLATAGAKERRMLYPLEVNLKKISLKSTGFKTDSITLNSEWTLPIRIIISDGPREDFWVVLSNDPLTGQRLQRLSLPRVPQERQESRGHWIEIQRVDIP